MNKIDLYNRAIGILTEVQALRDALKPDKTPPKSSETEKVPTPASDSVKGEHCPHSATTEKDRHGRSIIARNDFAMVVECPDGMYQVADTDGNWWYLSVQSRWVGEDCPEAGTLNRDYAIKKLALAASTPLPTANPAASAKVVVEPDIDAMRRAWNGVNTTTSYREDFLFAELLKLKRDLAELREATK